MKQSNKQRRASTMKKR